MLRIAKSVRASPSLTRALSSEFPEYIVNSPATQVSALENGLRVASETGHGDTATVGVFIDAGSRYETAQNNGTAHFLEHMAFKGTQNLTQQKLEEEIENMGGHLNAYTSREQTVYHAKVFKDDVPRAVEILSDILLNATLDEGAINRERGVILREAEAVSEMHDEVIFDMLHETAYQRTGLARTILGPTENIESLTRDDLESYIRTHYTAKRMVVAGAGAVDQVQLVDLAQQHFGSVLSEPPAGCEVPPVESMFTGSDIRLRRDEMPLAHVAIGFESAGATSAHAFPLLVMQTLIGNWQRTSTTGRNSSSKLAQACAEGGFAHSFMTFNMSYKDTGLFGVYGVGEAMAQSDFMWYVLDSLVRLAHETTDEEVERAKVQLKAQSLMQLDGSSPVCEDIGRQILTYGRRMTAPEIFARIDAVDAAAVKATASAVVHDQEHALAAMGPIHELPDINWIRRRSQWQRY